MRIQLVHGAWHGPWCWDKVISQLEAKGHTVAALDLPGLGADRTPAEEVKLQRYADAVCEVLITEDEPVLLVGHSRGGIVSSEAAERDGRVKIKTLVYVSADILVEDVLVIELKCAERLSNEHTAQCLNYSRAD